LTATWYLLDVSSWLSLYSPSCQVNAFEAHLAALQALAFGMSFDPPSSTIRTLESTVVAWVAVDGVLSLS
jgi:hypothetical protein